MKQELAEWYKNIIGNVEFAMNKWSYKKDELIVLCMHSTPFDRMQDFTKLVTEISTYFKPLKPAELEAYFRNEMHDGPYVLFTFDDGLRNNLHAAKALSDMGIGAYFFLIPDFIKASDQKSYYLNNIRQKIDPSFDKVLEDFTAINYDEARELVQDGHAIGSHTMSHLLRANMSDEEARREVIHSLENLQREFGSTVNSFCSPINTSISVDEKTKKMIESNYRFHFTTFPGKNGDEKNPLLIYRRNIEVNWPKGKIRFAIGQWDLPRWVPGIERFRAL